MMKRWMKGWVFQFVLLCQANTPIKVRCGWWVCVLQGARSLVFGRVEGIVTPRTCGRMTVTVVDFKAFYFFFKRFLLFTTNILIIKLDFKRRIMFISII